MYGTVSAPASGFLARRLLLCLALTCISGSAAWSASPVSGARDGNARGSPTANAAAQVKAPLPLQAASGMTALSGRVVDLDGRGLPGVVVADNSERTTTDAEGRWVLASVPVAVSVLRIDARHAGAKHGQDHGFYEVRVEALPGRTTVLPWVSWLPLVDHKHDVAIPSPTTSEVVVITPAIPDPELRIPAGTVVRDVDGRTVTRIGITALPFDRLARGPVRGETDAQGLFLLRGVAAGWGVLVIDGHDAVPAILASTPGAAGAPVDHGYYEVRVAVDAGRTTQLGWTSWLPRIDHAHDVAIASPLPAPVTVRAAAIPGLELRLPAGAVLTGPNGEPVRAVGITSIPLRRTPFPLPASVQVPVYFTAQPGGATISSADGRWLGAQVVYPNYGHELARARGTLWRYEPDGLGWSAYGTVTADATQVVPDEGILDLLSSITRIRVISAPKLVVLNNRTASLQVGDQVPIATASAVGVVTNNAPIVNTIQLLDTGIILRVTPRVNQSGLVLLDLAQEVSASVPTSSSSIHSPTIQQRRVATSVAVQDGQTIVTGGLIRDSRNRSRSGIPLPKGLPGVGFLFGQTSDQLDRTELIVLITQHVIRDALGADAATDELRAKLPLVRAFNAAAPR